MLLFFRVATPLLLLLPGCFGMCGPTLHRLVFTTPFGETLHGENRTLAENVVEDMGFNITSSGPGGFSTGERDGVSIWVGAGSAKQPAFTFNVYVFAGDKEYDSVDRARQVGHALAKEHWARYNATLSDFEQRTSWSRSGDSSVEPQVYVC